jgi:hypothetical protein
LLALICEQPPRIGDQAGRNRLELSCGHGISHPCGTAIAFFRTENKPPRDAKIAGDVAKQKALVFGVIHGPLLSLNAARSGYSVSTTRFNSVRGEFRVM